MAPQDEVSPRGSLHSHDRTAHTLSPGQTSVRAIRMSPAYLSVHSFQVQGRFYGLPL